MTNHVARLYALVGGVLVFFVAWAAVAAHPWGTSGTSAAADPRVAQLAARQHALQVESLRVKKIVDARWAAYRHALAQRKAQNATVAAAVPAQPAVRVVNLPPLVVTRTS